MKKEEQRIAEQIKELVDQWLALSGEQTSGKKPSKRVKPPKSTRGCSGALSILIEEGFFNKPRELPAVMSRLEEIGRYYPKTTVSMNLLNLTKRRTFNRIKNNKTKNWQYVLRR